MGTSDRPLSPHLQVYKLQLTSVLSILHRITGLALALGTLLLVWWLVAAALGEGAFEIVQNIIASWFGRVILLGWSFSLFYHLCNGIRHLFWDIGLGFKLSATYLSGWLVITASIVLTLGAWIWGYASMGAFS